MTCTSRTTLGLILLLAAGCHHNPGSPARSPLSSHGNLAIVGCDETTGWDDNLGLQPAAPGPDELLLIDLSSPGQPRVEARMPLSNSVYGPPTNLVLASSGRLALLASSIRMTLDAGKWTNGPDDEVHVIDLSGPVAKVTQVVVGKQPSGIDISPDGTLALVANRKGRSVSLLNLRTNPVVVLEEIAVDAEAADVKFTPDGKRAVVTNYDARSVTMLDVRDGHAKVAGRVDVEPFPYSVSITPNGRLALVGNMGDKTGSDGVDDAISVIDLQSQPPTVVQRIVVGDGPEGLAISPDGKLAAVVILNGSNAAPTAAHYHKTGMLRLLSIGGVNGNQVVAGVAINVGTMAEGAKFSVDGTHLIVGNFRDRDLTVLSVKDGAASVVRRVPLYCRPASMK